MDYDSDFGVLLDDAILPTDTLLVAQVTTPLISIYHQTCSIHPTYHNTLYQSSHPTPTPTPPHTHNTGRPSFISYHNTSILSSHPIITHSINHHTQPTNRTAPPSTTIFDHLSRSVILVASKMGPPLRAVVGPSMWMATRKTAILPFLEGNSYSIGLYSGMCVFLSVCLTVCIDR